MALPQEVDEFFCACGNAIVRVSPSGRFLFLALGLSHLDGECHPTHRS